MTDLTLILGWVILSVLCFAGYIYAHCWQSGNDLYLGDFLSMMLVSAIPVINLIVLLWALEKSILVVRGRR